MRSVVVVVGVAVALSLLGACTAKLDGAPCPCIEPEFTCIESANICRPAPDAGEHGDDVDAGPSVPDGGGIPDAGFFPDGSVGTPDAS